jgi:hypothetical protein
MAPEYRLVSRSIGLCILEQQAIVIQNELNQRPKQVISIEKAKSSSTTSDIPASGFDSGNDFSTFSIITSSRD